MYFRNDKLVGVASCSGLVTHSQKLGWHLEWYDRSSIVCMPPQALKRMAWGMVRPTVSYEQDRELTVPHWLGQPVISTPPNGYSNES